MTSSIYSRDNLRQQTPETPSFYYKDYNRLVRQAIFDRTHTVAAVDVGDLPRLAFKFYSDINLWWLIAYANGIVNPFTDMYVGQTLRIMSQDSVDKLFKKSSVSSSGTVRLR